MKENKKTLISIYNHNTPKITNQLYKELHRYKNDNYDIMLIDNGSKKKNMSKYTTHRLENNIYFGGALNKAIEYFHSNKDKYDSLFSMNNDLLLHGYRFIETFRNVMLNQNYKVLSPCILQPMEGQCFWKMMHCWNNKEVRKVKWVDFQAVLLDEEFLNYLDKYPDELVYGWGQDILTGIICKKNNWKVGVIDRCPVFHYTKWTHKKVEEIDSDKFHNNAKNNMIKYFKKEGLLNKLNEYRLYGRQYEYKE